MTRCTLRGMLRGSVPATTCASAGILRLLGPDARPGRTLRSDSGMSVHLRMRARTRL
jgi:hypothetical protein